MLCASLISANLAVARSSQNLAPNPQLHRWRLRSQIITFCNYRCLFSTKHSPNTTVLWSNADDLLWVRTWEKSTLWIASCTISACWWSVLALYWQSGTRRGRGASVPLIYEWSLAAFVYVYWSVCATFQMLWATFTITYTSKPSVRITNYHMTKAFQ